MKKVTIALGLLLSAFNAIASECSVSPSQRFQLIGEELAIGDTLQLVVGGYSINYEITEQSQSADQWPKYLAIELNNKAPNNFAQAGSAEHNYTPQQSATDNVLDIFDMQTQISLSKNGQDYSSQLVGKAIPVASYSKSMRIPYFHVNSGRAAYLFINNVSDKNVNVKVEYNYFDRYTGEAVAMGGYGVYAKFSNSNDPVASYALMTPNSFGQINMVKTSTSYSANALITWQANECLQDPITVSLEQWGDGGISVSYINDGQAF